MTPLRQLALAAGVALAVGTAGAQQAAAEPVAMAQQDQSFLVAVHQGNLAEMISGARAAVTGQGACEQVRRIGPMLVADHTRMDSMVVTASVRHGIVLPLSPDSAAAQRMLSTGRKTGSDFDRSWLLMQRDFHQQALTAIVQELSHGTSADITAMAAEAQPIVQQHLSMVQDALTHC